MIAIPQSATCRRAAIVVLLLTLTLRLYPQYQAGNAILAEDQHKSLYPEMVRDYDVEYIAGGATQNSIRVAQWMLQTDTPSTAFIGCIGIDDFGEQLEKAARGDGVEALYLKDETTPTGTCAVLVHEAERSLVANLSAANAYKHAHAQTPEIQAAVARARVFYTAGFFLTVSPETMEMVGKHAAENNKVFCLNLSAPFLIQFFGKQMDGVLPYTDFVFGNEDEAAAFGKHHGWTKEGEAADLRAIALRLSALPKASGARPRTVVFTQGSEKTLVAQNGTVREFDVAKLRKEALVDTNGAGDAFVGGFLSQLVQNRDISECVRAGHYAARIVIQRSGCSFPPQPDWA